MTKEMGLEATQTEGRKSKRVKAEESPERALKKVPEVVLVELVDLKSLAKGAAEDFAAAIEAQAEKHGMPKAALARYVAARCGNREAKLKAEVEAVQMLLGLG